MVCQISERNLESYIRLSCSHNTSPLSVITVATSRDKTESVALQLTL